VTKTNLRQHDKISLGPLESLGEAASGKVDAESFGHSERSIGHRSLTYVDASVDGRTRSRKF
jgi:hypothetical protein